MDLRRSFLLIRRCRVWNRLSRLALDLILSKVFKMVLHKEGRSMPQIIPLYGTRRGGAKFPLVHLRALLIAPEA